MQCSTYDKPPATGIHIGSTSGEGGAWPPWPAPCSPARRCNSETDPSLRAVRTQFSYIADQIRIYASENRRPPSPEDGLALLFDGQVPKDPWGHPVLYESPGPGGIAFDLVSYGADGVPGGKKEATDLRWSELK
ncbi:MAG: type II secretion system protein GspG [Deltaproteobacteria bacterium]|nr:type II secretion system protein GspG [Deltaproteobacteria bacterium]